ncbi:exported hypothetical protein [Pseudomonas veronii]|nr:exported hypothetical protein [Pseudomonas veronii]
MASKNTKNPRKVVAFWFFCHPLMLISARSSAFCDVTSRFKWSFIQQNGHALRARPKERAPDEHILITGGNTNEH